MFLKRRVDRLEKRLDKLEQKARCAKGNHAWVMSTDCYNDKPFIRCSECYAVPEKEDV